MDLEAKTPMRKDGIFRIASMSKPVTGVAILMLMEDGKVRLNDPVSRTEQIAAVLMIQRSLIAALNRDVENAVMQAVVE